MAIYELTFFVTHAGACLWSSNIAAREKYGYFIDIEELPLFKQTRQEIRNILHEYDTRANWDNGGKLWTWTDERRFKKKANELCKFISMELGTDYIVRSDRRCAQKCISSAFSERGFGNMTILDIYFEISAVIAPYYDNEINGENTNYEDMVYKGHHYRAVVTKVGGVCGIYPLDKYTPNFHPEKLKKIASSAEPYAFNDPILTGAAVRDPVIQARRKATFARLSLKEHYGTDDMSKWV